MSSLETRKALFSLGVSVVALVPLGLQGDWDLIEDHQRDILADVINAYRRDEPRDPSINAFLESAGIGYVPKSASSKEAVSDIMEGVHQVDIIGFLVELSIPMPTMYSNDPVPSENGNWWSSESQSLRATHTVYVDTLDGVLAHAEAFAAAVRAKAIRRAIDAATAAG